jgi:hypothetical protein
LAHFDLPSRSGSRGERVRVPKSRVRPTNQTNRLIEMIDQKFGII